MHVCVCVWGGGGGGGGGREEWRSGGSTYSQLTTTSGEHRERGHGRCDMKGWGHRWRWGSELLLSLSLSIGHQVGPERGLTLDEKE